MSAAIEFRNVSFGYEGVPVLDNVDLNIEKGEFLGIVGPNGGGKSTMLKLALGLLEPDHGQVTVMGRKPVQGRAMIGYVPQFAGFHRDFPITVEQAVRLGRLGLAPVVGGYRRADHEATRRAMHETRVFDLRRRTLEMLSGGELQRVLIARALVSNPDILLLDEPTANVDLRMEMDIFELLRDINRRATIVVVSHDIGFISRYVQRVACLNRTLICHTTAEITGEVIERLYGRPMRMVSHESRLPAGRDG